MGHNRKIGYPYLPAREPWRGQDVLQKAWRATLAGRRSGTRKRTLAGDPAGDGGRPWRGRQTTDSTQLWHSQNELGRPPWRGRRTTLAGGARGRSTTHFDGRAWTGPADDPASPNDSSHSQNNELGGRCWKKRTADNRDQTVTRKSSLAGDPGGHGGQPWRGAGERPGRDRPWRTTLAGRQALPAQMTFRLAKRLGCGLGGPRTVKTESSQTGTVDDPGKALAGTARRRAGDPEGPASDPTATRKTSLDGAQTWCGRQAPDNSGSRTNWQEFWRGTVEPGRGRRTTLPAQMTLRTLKTSLAGGAGKTADGT